MTDIESLLKKKNDLGDERDLCAEVYNVWITKMHEFQRDPVKYKMYMDMIQMLEPYGQLLKEEIRAINRKLCEIEGVDSIDQTQYFRECNNKYGKDRPNADI
jgi:hypothetical protein